jgi:antitoxin MazE
METIIKKWGNSLGVRIPNTIIKELSLENGSHVEIYEEADRIIIKPKSSDALNLLLNQITDDNIHEENNFSTPMGNEVW